ncbi:MAG: SIMPL domain-containing protein [Acidimicrobiales bacterium]|nr:SIMPL domain-containing protein [Acidimicrobiales bacterium]
MGDATGTAVTGPLVTVRGEAVAEVPPELAQVAVAVVARDRDRDRVVRDLDERARAVDAVLDRFADAVERVETDTVRVTPQFASSKPREKVSGYEGSVRRTVVVHRFEVLGDLLALLSGVELTTVTGPWWSLRPQSEAVRAVRVAAVHDAVRRAREYAGALGATLLTLEELADSDLLSAPEPRPMAVAGAAAQAFRGAPAPETFSFDLTPAPQVVHAAVEARFRATAPDLG